jgi:hypothetical protein
MNEYLSGFSQWTLDLLPRLFLYPGGLWALMALLWLRFVSGGVSALRPSALAAGLLSAPLLPTAIAWVALALLPLPGTSPLAFPADRLALAGLLVASLVLSQPASDTGERAAPYLEVAITLAIMAPLAGGRGLLSAGDWGPAGWIALAAVVAGLASLPGPSVSDLAGNLRLLAWFGLAAYPVWSSGSLLPQVGVVWASLVYAAAIALIAGPIRLAAVKNSLRVPVLPAICWGLSVLALLLALAT